MRYPLLVGSLIALSAIALWLWLQSRPDAKSAIRAHDPPAALQNRIPSIRPTIDLGSRDRHQQQLILQEWNALLAWLDETPPPSPEEIRVRLRSLRSAWAQLDPHVLASSLHALLQSQQNRSTGLTFTVGPQGFLSAWPDLRSFLVDTLAIADPTESAKIARSILSDTDSPAEFSLAIRSLLRGGDTDASPSELLACLHTLLGRESWQNDPATLEALDLARHLGDTDAANAILNWNGNSKARDMALHEFAAEHPDVMLDTLAHQPEKISTQSAALLARADPADPAQAALIDAYIRNPDIPLEHRQSFLSLYPLRSITAGYRLYHGNPKPYSKASIRRSDEAALAQANAYLADPSLAPLHESLTEWKNRLLDWRKSNP